MNFFRGKILKDNSGLTLIEIMVIITLLSIITAAAVPKISGFFSNKRENFAIFTGIITKVFDDSFLNDKTNYLVVHLFEASESEEETESGEIFSRQNGLSVVNLIDDKFVENERNIFHFKQFPDSFKIEEVILASGESITMGSVMIPFYPQGSSDNIIFHILTDDSEKYSIRLYKYIKEPEVTLDYIYFEDLQ